MFGTVPVFSVPVRILYRTYRDARYRYWCWTKITEVAGTGMKVCTGTGGTGIYVVPKLPKCPVQVFMAYPSYRSAQYRHWCRTDLTEVSGTGIDVVPNLPMCPAPVLMSYRYRYRHRYRPGYIYRECMYRAYPVFHVGTHLGIFLYAVQKVPFGLWAGKNGTKMNFKKDK